MLFLFIIFFPFLLGLRGDYCGSTGYTYCGCTSIAPAMNSSFLAAYELKQLQVVIRHGDRTPVNTLPAPYVGEEVKWECDLDNYILATNQNRKNGSLAPPDSPLFLKQYDNDVELLPGNCYFGQLTMKGLQQHQTIGAAVRSAYAGLIPMAYSPATVHLRSTDFPRTFDSLQGELSSIFGFRLPSAGAVDIEQVIPIHTRDAAVDTMTGPMPGLCPRLQRHLDDVQASDAWRALLDDYDWVFDAYRRAFPEAGDPTMLDMGALNDVLLARGCHDQDLPRGLTRDDAQGIFALCSQAFDMQFNDTTALALGIGNFVADMVAMLSNDQNRLVFWSAHDSTLFPLQRVMGFEEPLWPPYASHMFLELWESNTYPSEKLIRMHYNGVELEPPGCQGMGATCPLSSFIRGISDFVVTDLKKSCKL